MTWDPPRYDHWMRAFLKFIGVLFILALVVGLGAWVWAGRAAGPTLQIRQPDKVIGQATAFELMGVTAQRRVRPIDVAVEQHGQTLPTFSLGQPSPADREHDTTARIYISR